MILLINTIESHSNSIMMDKYSKMNDTIERLSKIFYKILVEYSMPACVIPSTALTLLNYFVFNIQDDPYVLGLPILYVIKNLTQHNMCAKYAWISRLSWNFVHFHSRFPFNWKTPFGYMVALLLATWLVFSLSFCGALANFFFAGLCWLLAAFIRDVNNDFAHFIVRKETNRRNSKQTKIKLCKIIRELSRVKQLSMDSVWLWVFSSLNFL